jgi:hypothetical protein
MWSKKSQTWHCARFSWSLWDRSAKDPSWVHFLAAVLLWRAIFMELVIYLWTRECIYKKRLHYNKKLVYF